MIFEGTTIDDLRTILLECIFLYKGNPVRVLRIDDEQSVTAYDFQAHNHIKIALNDPEMSYEPFPLGFVNGPKEAAYMLRLPIRQYRQGLHSENTSIVSLGERQRRDWHLGIFQENKYIMQVAKGIYPSLAEAIDEICKDEKIVSRAISRNFAIENTGSLFFKDARVGLIDFDTGQPMFMRNKQYLSWIWECRNESV